MGQDTIQPTPIDADEYEQFRSFVADVHGRVRGHLATELENALREYRESYYGGDRLKRIEDDIATIKANVADAEADGGAAPQAASEANSTRPRDSGKPAANQPRGVKLDYLIDEFTEDSGTFHTNALRNIIDEEYGFAAETTDEYIDLIIERLDAVEDPEIDSVYLFGDAIDERMAELEQDAKDELDDL
jgi:hypothetical protein